MRNELQKHSRLVVLGDYNIAPEDQDVHDAKAWEGSVHVSEPERAELRELFSIGLCDLYRKFQHPQQASAGGITGWAHSGAITVCAST